VKASRLIAEQYGPVAESAALVLPAAVDIVSRTAARGVDTGDLLDRWSSRALMAEAYTAAVERYCRQVESVDDLRVAPFHVMATEGKVHTDKTHQWHMETIGGIAARGDGMLVSTAFLRVDLADDSQREGLYSWWDELTASGGEGIVVKPGTFVVRGKRVLLQPALKCRGREYLRIIYGPEYTEPHNLSRLKQKRGLSAKRALAVREFGLGIEALERFVRYEPLRRVHECISGVLALESQPVDPRL
jgi:protein phosphatase